MRQLSIHSVPGPVNVNVMAEVPLVLGPLGAGEVVGVFLPVAGDLERLLEVRVAAAEREFHRPVARPDPS